MERRKPKAVFMAFGTQGDVYPLAAIAAAFATDQKQYNVILITHSAHQSLSSHLCEKHVEFCAVSSPPVLSADQSNDIEGEAESSFLMQKKKITRDHRRECFSLIEKIFGDDPCLDGDLIVINFFALEGWSLAECFSIRCIVAAPYVVPYSAPATFERQFQREFPLLYKYLIDAPAGKVCWKDVDHWMWPLFTENWGSWRNDNLRLSPCPFTDPVTGIPTWYDRPQSPLVMYGFSKEVVECPAYWPSRVRVCGFWFLPIEWQFTCTKCRETLSHDSSGHKYEKNNLCPCHLELQNFVKATPIFIGLSAIGSMGFLKDPHSFICVLQAVLSTTDYKFILFTGGYEPLESVIRTIATEAKLDQNSWSEDFISLYNGRLFCFFSSVPYGWLFPKCAAVIHHGGSGTTAAALQAGTPQMKNLLISQKLHKALSEKEQKLVEMKDEDREDLGLEAQAATILCLERDVAFLVNEESTAVGVCAKVVCPFVLDQFYWAERMHWLDVSPEPLSRNHLLPDKTDDKSIQEAAHVLSHAVHDALSSRVRRRSAEIAEKLFLEDGVSEAIKYLKEELSLI